jgi:uncharacterized protein
MPMNTLSVVDQTKATAIAHSIAVADTILSRFFGLMGKRAVSPAGGLWISPSSGVHTCWMRMPIDIVALDSNLRIVKLGHRVGPWRISGLGLKTRSVLELAAGRIEECGLAVGDQLKIVPVSEKI